MMAAPCDANDMQYSPFVDSVCLTSALSLKSLQRPAAGHVLLLAAYASEWHIMSGGMRRIQSITASIL